MSQSNFGMGHDIDAYAMTPDNTFGLFAAPDPWLKRGTSDEGREVEVKKPNRAGLLPFDSRPLDLATRDYKNLAKKLAQIRHEKIRRTREKMNYFIAASDNFQGWSDYFEGEVFSESSALTCEKYKTLAQNAREKAKILQFEIFGLETHDAFDNLFLGGEVLDLDGDIRLNTYPASPPAPPIPKKMDQNTALILNMTFTDGAAWVGGDLNM